MRAPNPIKIKETDVNKILAISKVLTRAMRSESRDVGTRTCYCIIQTKPKLVHKHLKRDKKIEILILSNSSESV